ncbi:ankyrin repeat-containing domain protein [Parachaetomium inaequale]|uniref:Ankyrin repeat-containing domain protein n=1 Tax=Parachaetomium inaequale TaxID=2588326 RepID=A0AAN6P7A8_9PEZI|nr:ankyrin repeat-containing domain protein [Parachaetomium inaequale]
MSGNKWQSPLHMAAQKGHNGIVCLLLEQDVDCNEGDSEGLTPLMHAVIGGFQDVAGSLLARGARVGATDGQDRSALHWAVVHRREALLRLLLEHWAGDGGGDERGVVDGYDADGKTPLHAAIEAGFEAGVHVLLEFGADVKSRAGVS